MTSFVRWIPQTCTPTICTGPENLNQISKASSHCRTSHHQPSPASVNHFKPWEWASCRTLSRLLLVVNFIFTAVVQKPQQLLPSIQLHFVDSVLHSIQFLHLLVQRLDLESVVCFNKGFYSICSDIHAARAPECRHETQHPPCCLLRRMPACGWQGAA